MFERQIKELNRIHKHEASKGLYTIEELQELLSISRPTVFKFIKDECLKTVKVGRRTMVTKASFNLWLDDEE
jgi:excisionase family DNA binding protein